MNNTLKIFLKIQCYKIVTMKTLKEAITTQRLSLHSLSEYDNKALITVLKSDEVSKFYMVPELKTSEDETKLFSILLDLSHRDDRYVYGIYLNDILIGIINDTEIAGSRIELGYAMNPDYFGCGYMTEALNGMIKHLFNRGFKEVVAGAFQDNIASIRVMQKCGMSLIERTDKILYRNVYRTCIFYSIKK